MTARLSLDTLAGIDPAARPPFDPRAVSVGIVHLGIGAFHRAHQAVYTQGAMAATGDTSWGICGVTQRSRSSVDALAPQDGLFSVLEREDGSARASVIGSVREVIFARESTDVALDRLAAPSTRVVTLTVTEKGYRHEPSTGRLRVDDPEVAADLAGRPPTTVIGQLVRGLQRRRQRDSGPLAIVCCDNLPSNGRTVRGLVEDFVSWLPAAQAAGLREWIGGHVSFPCTMVDRIVPATTAADRTDAARLLGVRDDAVVVAEPFRQWVIEDDFPAGRPAWEADGATFTEDVGSYEEMKLRLLNGSHSSLAYLGSLAGCEFIADAIRAPGFGEYIRALTDVDVTPTLSVPDGFDLATYKEELLGRFANRALRHRTVQVAMDGSQKLPQRLLGVIRDRLAVGAVPRFSCLAVAGWMRYVSAGRSDDGRELPLDDPLAGRLRDAVAGASSPGMVASGLLQVREVFGADLPAEPVFRSQVTGWLAAVSEHGVAAAVSTLVSGGSSRRAESARAGWPATHDGTDHPRRAGQREMPWPGKLPEP